MEEEKKRVCEEDRRREERKRGPWDKRENGGKEDGDQSECGLDRTELSVVESWLE